MLQSVCGGECRNGMTPKKESSSPSNGTSPIRVCCVRRKSPIAAVAQDFIPREEIRRGGSYLVYQLIFLPTLEEAHALLYVVC